MCVCDKETEFLEYIDSERLPPLLVDLFEKAQVFLSFINTLLYYNNYSDCGVWKYGSGPIYACGPIIHANEMMTEQDRQIK